MNYTNEWLHKNDVRAPGARLGSFPSPVVRHLATLVVVVGALPVQVPLGVRGAPQPPRGENRVHGLPLHGQPKGRDYLVGDTHEEVQHGELHDFLYPPQVCGAVEQLKRLWPPEDLAALLNDVNCVHPLLESDPLVQHGVVVRVPQVDKADLSLVVPPLEHVDQRHAEVAVAVVEVLDLPVLRRERGRRVPLERTKVLHARQRVKPVQVHKSVVREAPVYPKTPLRPHDGLLLPQEGLKNVCPRNDPQQVPRFVHDGQAVDLVRQHDPRSLADPRVRPHADGRSAHVLARDRGLEVRLVVRPRQKGPEVVARYHANHLVPVVHDGNALDPLVLQHLPHLLERVVAPYLGQGGRGRHDVLHDVVRLYQL
mmetsp:Transcript_12310/g.34238  ORF Transcript_12310/g.34238 Transcript_12310/m.34238 type:complete len:368 (-) Transcript_12310:327-1430(-)